MVSDRLVSSTMQIQQMVAEVWRSIFCMGKLVALTTFLSEPCLGIKISKNRWSVWKNGNVAFGQYVFQKVFLL